MIKSNTFLNFIIPGKVIPFVRTTQKMKHIHNKRYADYCYYKKRVVSRIQGDLLGIYGKLFQIKKECGEEVSKLKTLIEEYRQKLILKDEQIKVISEDNKLLAKLVGEKYGQNSGS